MTMAMTGLIGYQVYWIDNAIKINDVQFEQNVHDALNTVISRLEKNEVYFTASQQFQNSLDPPSFFSPDSNAYLKKFYYDRYAPNIRKNDSQRRNKWMSDIILKDSIVLGEQQINISFQLKNNIPWTNQMEAEGQFRERREEFELNIQSYQNFDSEIQRSIQKIAQKSHMVTVVLDEMFSEQPRIENRINKNELKELLDTELKNRGIHLDYEFGIVDKQQNIFIMTGYQPQDKQNILTSGFTVKLFPNDLQRNNYFLSVFFPDQAGFLLKKVWFTLTSSILLVLLIISLFGYAVFAIIRQKKISEIKNDFINNMTHEFKTPISTIALACEALQDNDIKKNKLLINNYINMVREENNRLTRQVEKVLQMATLDKKEYKLKPEEIDIHQIIQNAIHNISLQVSKKGGEIRERLIAENHIIYSDEVHLTNIIYNLLDNANKYSTEKPMIQVETEDHHQGILIRIKDEGIGMTKDVLDKIFEKFYRVPTGNIHDVKGFGLGLTYVKSMVAALGGFIKVKSKPSEGSTFEIILPLKAYGSN